MRIQNTTGLSSDRKNEFLNKSVRLIYDAVGDIAKRYMRRKGIVIGIFTTDYDEVVNGKRLRLFHLKFPNRKKPLPVYEDEFEEVVK